MFINYDAMLYDVIITRHQMTSFESSWRVHVARSAKLRKKIEVQRKKSAMEVFEAQRKACRTSALSLSRTITRLENVFKSGRDTVKDHHREYGNF